MSCLDEVWLDRQRLPLVGLPPNLWPGVREWGFPSLCMPGKMWRSERFGTISMMVAHPTDRTLVLTETRDLTKTSVVMGWPAGWSDAMLEYWTAWPASARTHEAIMLEEHRAWF